MPSVLTLIGIPGLESLQFRIGIRFFVMYIIALFGNFLLLVVITVEQSLHEAMYLFLAMLGATDIALSTRIFWFHLSNIHFDACLLQMWLIHTFQCIESGILFAMAMDRYMRLLKQIPVGVTLRGSLFVAPCLILIKCRLKFYWTTVVSHSYCEHMAIVNMAAEDVRVNKIYSLFVAFNVLGLDIVFTTLFYIRIFIIVFKLPQKEARLKAFNTCLHLCVLGVLSPGLLFGIHIPSKLYLLVSPLLSPIVYGMKTK
uniref:G-protein coupled receptors family 1 profile domain-containing protein n=1 Tax=Cricetulus griseus TaxID=10029 RepID=A0A8C2N334_CRIGR